MKIISLYSVAALLFSIFLPIRSSIAQTTYKNNQAGYTIVLPQDWYYFQESDSQDIFYDINGSAQSYLSVVYHPVADGTTELDWTNFHYIMYLTITTEWEDPWGSILAMDSSQSSTVGSVWAPQAFAQFYTLDTATNNKYWSEYIIFTAQSRIGYELYAIGDTSDIKANGATYSEILHSITFSKPSAAIRKNSNSRRYTIISPYQRVKTFDLCGRIISSAIPARKTPMVLIKNKSRYLSNLR
jgi:hypothetical protein